MVPIDRIITMEWKKSPKNGHSRKVSTGEDKKSISIHDKNTKRKLKSKHKKILTEGVATYTYNAQFTTTSPKKAWINSAADDTTVCQRTQASFSRSYHHNHSRTALESDLEQVREGFQKENDRLKAFLNTFELRNKKVLTVANQQQKEGISQKIKKQNILLKSVLSPTKAK